MTRDRRRAKHVDRVLRPACWSPMNLLLSLGGAVAVNRNGSTTTLCLPYGRGAVVLEPPHP